MFAFAFGGAVPITRAAFFVAPLTEASRESACVSRLSGPVAGSMPRDVRPKCDLPLLEKDAEDVFGDGGAADDSREFALVINHGKLFELLLRQ